MSSDLSSLGREVEAVLRDRADAQRREVTSRYFRTRLEVLGVPVPQIREVVRRVHRQLGKEPPRKVVGLARILHAGRTHEGRQAGYELLERRMDARALLDTPQIRGLGDGNDNWASVDAFCVCVSGRAWREGRLTDEDIFRWARSRDRWWRRAALVSTVPLNLRSRGGTGDPSRTLAICGSLVLDRDPMVAKGLSWALRSAIPHDREAVRTFVEEWWEELPSLVRREVRNKLETGRKNPTR
jgi:3-methyladenine DNA glycosylase AlkD